jgi:hypothetical protein
LIVLVGLALLVAPTAIRTYWLGYGERTYQPPEGEQLTFAVTPEPTATPRPVDAPPSRNIVDSGAALRTGPVVVDLAHFNSVNPIALQPLADALAQRGVGLQLWLSAVDVFEVTNFLDFPDQSETLADYLADASALVVISPFFLWSAKEIALVEQFVADGGRLLLISDPDLSGDLAAVTNFLAEPFGIVFNDDYLYDTVENDENFTHFFQGAFLDQAAALDGARIAFYGGRSISGAVAVQAVSAPSTLSSLRTGGTSFTTMAIGGTAASGTAGRVLALSDFDVLSEPYIRRHDNQLLVEFVAGFLAADERTQLIADFPNYLGKSVALTYGSQNALGADLVLLGAQLQKRLEQSTRALHLVGPTVLTGTVGVSATTVAAATDLIYLAEYEQAARETQLLGDNGIALQAEIITPTTPVATRTPTPTPTPITTATITTTVAATTTSALTPTATPTPTTRLILVMESGLRLAADQTVTILQQRDQGDGALMLAVLATDAKGIAAGVQRLLANDLTDCITGESATFCPLTAESASKSTPAPDGTRRSATPTTTATPTPDGDEPDGDEEDDGVLTLLLVDDNQTAGEEEGGEGDIFLQALLAGGYTPDLWTTEGNGLPTVDELAPYDWVIWSNAAYAQSTLTPEELTLLSDYLTNGGTLTVSSRDPLFGSSEGEASQIRDLVVADTAGELGEGLDSMVLSAEILPAVPLTDDLGEPSGQVVLRRGPESEDADAPALLVVADPESDARLQVSGIAMTWLPPEAASQLIQNLAAWVEGQ